MRGSSTPSEEVPLFRWSVERGESSPPRPWVHRFSGPLTTRAETTVRVDRNPTACSFLPLRMPLIHRNPHRNNPSAMGVMSGMTRRGLQNCSACSIVSTSFTSLFFPCKYWAPCSRRCTVCSYVMALDGTWGPRARVELACLRPRTWAGGLRQMLRVWRVFSCVSSRCSGRARQEACSHFPGRLIRLPAMCRQPWQNCPYQSSSFLLGGGHSRTSSSLSGCCPWPGRGTRPKVPRVSEVRWLSAPELYPDRYQRALLHRQITSPGLVEATTLGQCP